MKIAAIAFTRNGGEIVKVLVRELGADGYIASGRGDGFLVEFESLSALMKSAWSEYGALVFVGACGIAVRAVAPYVKDKASDSAVVVIDEKGKFVIPILSGHLGGANELAEKIARLTGGTAVITTATDINGKFSVDMFALKNNLNIGDTKLIKEISARVLEGHKIGLYSDYELKNVPDFFTDSAEVGICISGEDKRPFKITLNLAPKNLVIGIGCRRGCASVKRNITRFLDENGVDAARLCAVATINIKKDEEGIRSFCTELGLPLVFYGAGELSALNGDFIASDFVKETVGVDNVCERAVAAYGAEIIVKKTALESTALALGEKQTVIDFAL